MASTNYDPQILQENHDHLARLFSDILDLLSHEQVERAKPVLLSLHPADLADFLDSANFEIRKIVGELLNQDLPAETLIWLSHSSKYSMERILKVEVLASLIDELDVDDAIETVEGFSEEVRENILVHIGHPKSLHIKEGLNYHEDSVGRVMERNFIALSEHWSVGQSLDYIKKQNTSQDSYAAIIVDSKNRPVGTILLCKLLQSSRSAPISEIKKTDLRVVYTSTKIQQLSYAFKQYALSIMPVINKAGKLIGVVSIDNMIYIVEQLAEDEALHLGGIYEIDTFYSLMQTSISRFPWLFLNLISAFLTSIVVNKYSETILHLVALATVMPIVASMGGAAGSQVTTVTVAAISNRDINSSNRLSVIFKEIMVGLINGVCVGILSGYVVYMAFDNYTLGIIFCTAVMLNALFAGIAGTIVPLTFNRLGFDPAIASGIIVSAVTDTMGFFVLLTLAYFFII